MHTAVYDAGSKRMMIFGGNQGFVGTVRNDVWVLKDANGIGTPVWEKLNPTGTPPAPRDGATAFYDKGANRLVIFGGIQVISSTTIQPNYNDVWALTNANGLGGTPQWIQLNPAGTLPLARAEHSIAYDPATNQMIVFGGYFQPDRSLPNFGTVGLNDVWVLTGANGLAGTTQWTQRTVTGSAPTARSGTAVLFSSASNRLVVTLGANRTIPLVGPGLLNDVWALNSVLPSVRNVCAGNVSAAPGTNVIVPFELTAQGDENALGFSITFDTNILSNPQVALGSDAAGASLNLNTGQTAQGKLGIAVALPATQKFTAGTRQLVNITFTIAANAQATTTTIGFGDQPIAREVVSDAANTLPASYTPGSVTVTPGYEADVSPRPNGNNNGTVTIADWVQVGRFAAGVDTAAAGSEFQRADCAPKDTKGDGRVSIADWVQAGRYAAAVDAVVAAGGPTAPVSGLLADDLRSPVFSGSISDAQLAAEAGATNAARVVRAMGTSIEPGRSGTMAIEIDAMGDENALGFSLNFDAVQLQFVSAAVGSGVSGASLHSNTAQAMNGRVGIALALPTNQTFVAGKRQLIVVTFAAKANANAIETAVTMGDLPVGREIVDAAANTLNATWSATTVTLARPVASVSAASFNGDVLASEAIVAAFGSHLASATQIATTVPLPTSLTGTSVKVKDSAGVERLAPLFFVAPTQINYLVPAGTALGEASINVTSSDGVVSGGKVRIANVAPGLFSTDASGQGIAAASVLRIKSDGSQSYEPVGHFDPVSNRFVATPIDLSVSGDQVFLILFGTGLRYRNSLPAASARIGGSPVEVLYVGEQGGFVGLDQVNLRLPRSLAGRGEVEIALSLDGMAANAVRVSIK
ncbi:MAG: cohesin domain-containing protein [Acidobacteriota bacterium]